MGFDYLLFFIIPNLAGGLYMLLAALGLSSGRVRHSARPVDNYLVVVVTVGNERVLPALRETVAQLERLGLRYVVVSSRPLPFSNVLVVPREADGTKYRAIKWFVENYARADMWYIFLDDDSYPLDSGFLRDIAYYGGRGYVAGNGIIVPRPGRSALAYALDWVRYFHDLTLYRFALEVLRRPIFGMHGELLIVRGDVLKEVWPAMGDTVAEDFRFAMELAKRGYKTFQSATLVSIKSPNSLADFVRQRARWAAAVAEAFRYRNPYYVVLILIVPAVLWLGALGGASYGYLGTPQAVAAMYLAVYTYGSIKARRYIIDVFVASLLELVGLAVGIVRKAASFYIIDKR
ncbi:MAG: egghead [Pyrobaculum arsenaticum]|uniref:glycosyltransferase family 2 protein n=1 Tax=Pyrobaculum arsenaticum TaxID=121277 RepID=UPI0022767328|nr:egghead [Pyrobaculum arsenaticum]